MVDEVNGLIKGSSDPDPFSPPPSRPPTSSDGCTGDLHAALATLVHREVAIAQRLLSAATVPDVLAAQIEAVRTLLAESGLHCTLEQINAQLRLSPLRG